MNFNYNTLKNILSEYIYFLYFGYFPKEREVYLLFPYKIEKSRFKYYFNLIEKNKELIFKVIRQKKTIQLRRREFYKKKISSFRFRVFLKLLESLRSIKLVALSGSLVYKVAHEKDDIDLFIVTKAESFWTTRFIVNFLAILLMIKRKKGVRWAQDKVCLNLFFSEKSLEVPNKKKNPYVAREVLKVKPLINKDYTYERFLFENKWVLKYLPNAEAFFLNLKTFKFFKKNEDLKKTSFLEKFLKKIQLIIIYKNRTKELILSDQLWFFPKDFTQTFNKLQKEAERQAEKILKGIFKI